MTEEFVCVVCGTSTCKREYTRLSCVGQTFCSSVRKRKVPCECNKTLHYFGDAATYEAHCLYHLHRDCTPGKRRCLKMWDVS
jgi:hypothetical protein